MDKIDLQQIINNFPECLTNGEKLKAILADTYPKASRGVIYTISMIATSGIAKEIESSINIDKMAIDKWLKRLECNYCMSGTTVENCLQLWVDSFIQEERIPLSNKKTSLELDNEEIVYNIEFGLPEENFFVNLQQYIKYCAHAIKNISKCKGAAFHRLANQLHEYDLAIRSKRIDSDGISITYKIDEHTSSDEPFQWENIHEEINAIKTIANTKTNNINCLIEQLLLLAAQNKCTGATDALEETYLNLYPYENYDEYDPYDEPKIPWFDITNMSSDFNAFEDESELDLQNETTIDENIEKAFAQKALGLLRKTRDYVFSDETSNIDIYYYKNDEISNIANYYKTLDEVLGDVVYKKELSYIKSLADQGKPAMIELILDLYMKYLPSDYFGRLIEYGEAGDYNTQCKIAEFYDSQYKTEHQQIDFDEAVKWYEFAVNNKKKEVWDSSILEKYKSFLEHVDKQRYANKISELQECINNCIGEYDYMLSRI